MIYQKKLIKIIIFLFIGASFLFAQNIPENRVVLNGKTGVSAELSLNWSAKNLRGNSLLIKTPPQIFSVPLQISLNGQSLWLMKSDRIPQKADVVHWQSRGNQLVMRFASGILKTGSRLFFRIHQNIQSPSKKITGTEALQLFTVRKNNQNKPIPGELLNQLQIPVESGLNNK